MADRQHHRPDFPRALVAARLLVPGTVLAGFVLGVLVTLTSVGAGALGMTRPALHRYRHRSACRVRHRTRRSADPHRRARALLARIGERAAGRDAAARLRPGHRSRQPSQLTDAGGRGAIDRGRPLDPRESADA